MSLSQIELVWVSIRVEWEYFWVNLREDNKVSESKMAVSEFKMAVSQSNMAEFKMVAIIKLSQNEWVNFFCVKWLNPSWQNSRCLPSSSWVRMNGFESDWISLGQIFVQNSWIQDERIQDGCYHMSWVKVNEWSFLCKWWEPILASVSEFELKNQDGQIQDGRIQDGCQYQFRREWLSLSQIELFEWALDWSESVFE